MRPRPSHQLVSLALGGLLVGTLAACATTDASDADSVLAVRSSADACEVSAEQVPSGTIVFEVTNDGSDVTEFYLYGDDGSSVVGEVENIGPGLTRNLAVEVQPGTYITACKPGMEGAGIRGELAVVADDQSP